MPRKEEVKPKQKASSARSTADDVPKSKLDLSIREGRPPGKVCCTAGTQAAVCLCGDPDV